METNSEKLKRIKFETDFLAKVSPNLQFLIQQAEEFERYKKYVMYFCGKDKVNDIRLAMEENELD